jgi:outer membrane protein, heavy metal efflux system
MSPELQARALESDAAAARVEAAGALEDPTLTVTSDEDRDERGRRLNEMVYGLEQEVPLWGKRDLRRRVAAAEAAGAKARERLALLELDARIKATFAAYWRASRALGIQDEVHTLLQAVAEAAQGRYAQGLGSQADAIRAEVERSRLTLERRRLERDRLVAATRLNALLARPAGAALAEPLALRPVPDEARLTLEELLATARERSPLLASADAEIDAAEGDRRLVERSWYPDVTLGAAAIQREDGPEGYTL